MDPKPAVIVFSLGTETRVQTLEIYVVNAVIVALAAQRTQIIDTDSDGRYHAGQCKFAQTIAALADCQVTNAIGDWLMRLVVVKQPTAAADWRALARNTDVVGPDVSVACATKQL